jgi:hypothetical protein
LGHINKTGEGKREIIMERDKTDNRMKREITLRMESRSWDLSMAASVLEKKKLRKKTFFLFSASASSLAAVSLLIFVFLFGTEEKSVDKNYSNFISSQLKGTYETVFTDVNKTESDPDKKKSFVAQQVQGTYSGVFDNINSRKRGSNGTGDILSSDIDSMIDTTLAQR